MATTAAKRRETPRGRTCEHCDRPLPASATSQRKFCSSRCRWQSWNAANRPEDGRAWESVPLHWHDGRIRMLVGNGLTSSRTYWRGFGCPPECTTPLEPGEWSIGIRPGREGPPPALPETPPEFAHKLSWYSIADPADYGVKVNRRKAGGELVSLAAERRRH